MSNSSHPLLTCPLCEEFSPKFHLEGYTYEVRCQVCGQYYIPLDLAQDLPGDREVKDQRYLISGFTRERTELGEPVHLSREGITTILSSGIIPKTPQQKVDKTLQFLARRTEVPGHAVRLLGPSDHSIGYAKEWSEVRYYLSYLEEQKLVSTIGEWTITVTVPGWERVRVLEQAMPSSRICFIAMWFDESMHKVYEDGISPALNDTGYEPLRIDRLEHVNKIDDEIIAGIRKSKFVIADFTNHRGGVYFEAGFALGLGRNVIWTCRKSDLTLTHFDTRQFNHIDWETPAELRERLRNRIQAVIV